MTSGGAGRDLGQGMRFLHRNRNFWEIGSGYLHRLLATARITRHSIPMADPTHLATELVRSGAKPLLDSVGDVWGLILGDRIAFYRRANAMKLSKRLHEQAQKMGGQIDTDKIPDQFAFEWAEAATKQSDETLQDMYTKLLLNAAEGGSADSRMIYALKEMTPPDARLFNLLYADRRFGHLSGERGYVLEHLLYSLSSQSGFDDVELALDNLVRIALVRELTGLKKANSQLGSQRSQIKMTTQRLIKPSALGALLYKNVSNLAS